MKYWNTSSKLQVKCASCSMLRMPHTVLAGGGAAGRYNQVVQMSWGCKWSLKSHHCQRLIRCVWQVRLRCINVEHQLQQQTATATAASAAAAAALWLPLLHVAGNSACSTFDSQKCLLTVAFIVPHSVATLAWQRAFLRHSPSGNNNKTLRFISTRSNQTHAKLNRSQSGAAQWCQSAW